TVMLSFRRYGDTRDLHSFPTRRSSDLLGSKAESSWGFDEVKKARHRRPTAHERARYRCFLPDLAGLAGKRRAGPKGSNGNGLFRDRKSTRLNSSHVESSDAIFCLNTTS